MIKAPFLFAVFIENGCKYVADEVLSESRSICRDKLLRYHSTFLVYGGKNIKSTFVMYVRIPAQCPHARLRQLLTTELKRSIVIILRSICSDYIFCAHMAPYGFRTMDPTGVV